MRILRFLLISFFILFCLGFEAHNARAQYIGEFCWQDDEGGIARFAVTRTPNGQYAINGRHTDPPPSSEVTAVNGNGERVGSQIIMHITSSSFDANEVRAFLATIVLNVPGFNGTMEGLNLYVDKITGARDITYDGPITLTRVPCP